MFNFWRKRVVRENAKLVHQTYLALNYLNGYYGEAIGRDFGAEIEICLQGWRYEMELDQPKFERMWAINKELRRLYDRSVGRTLASFDKQFQPTLGWKDFYDYHGL